MNLSGGGSGASASAGLAASAAMSVMSAFISLHTSIKCPPKRKLSSVYVGRYRRSKHIDSPRGACDFLGLASLEA